MIDRAQIAGGALGAEARVTATSPEEAKYWVGFHRVPYVGPVRIERLIRHFGTLERAWSAPGRALTQVLDERAAESVQRTRGGLDLDVEMERIERAGIRVVTRQDAGYPRLLAEILSPPPVLYVRGSLLPEDDRAVGIVGTRRSTAVGREVAGRMAEGLAAARVTVVSGLARGIDAVAHEGALRAGGRTIAVLGSGPDVVYPPEHRGLAERIAASGAVISDYPPGRGPEAQHFPARNRIISGLSLGVVLVEAPARSGALITADFAADQGREVFVVPGSVLAAANAGSNRLLRDGASPVCGAEDVLEDLRLGGGRPPVATQQALPLGEDERRLLRLLGADPVHIDELAAAAGLPIAEASVLLLQMELAGSVRNAGAQHYTRA